MSRSKATQPRAPEGVTQRPCDRRRKCKAPVPAERLVIVKRMMAEGLWREGASDKELAKEWECDSSTIRRTAAEASRAIISQIQDATFGARLVTILLDNITSARQAKRYEAVARSVEVAMRITGIDHDKPPPPDANTLRPASIRFIEAAAPPEDAA